MKNKVLLSVVLFVLGSKLWAQQAFTVTDTQPVTINGLTIGYNIKSTEVKNVSGRGDFSRYAISFYVYNIDNTPKIIRVRGGNNQPGFTSSQLVQFNILNATGYRLTSNSATINAAPYNVDEPGRGPRLVGYWIQGGQTINVDEIVICPLNQLPNVQAILVATNLQPFERREFERPREQPPVVYQAPPQVFNDFRGFFRIKNVLSSFYINNQSGFAACTGIEPGWYSAQWEFLSIPGTNYFKIKNRWKETYLHEERGIINLEGNSFSPSSSWSLEPDREPNSFRIKNVKTGGYLFFADQQLILSNDFHEERRLTWWLERP